MARPTRARRTRSGALQRRLLDDDRHDRLLVVGRRHLRDPVDDVLAARHLADERVLRREAGVRGGDDEELAPRRAGRLRRRLGHRDRVLRVLRARRRLLAHGVARAAEAVAERVAALDDERAAGRVGRDAVERQRVVEDALDEGRERRRGLRRLVDGEGDRERAAARLHHDAGGRRGQLRRRALLVRLLLARARVAHPLAARRDRRPGRHDGRRAGGRGARRARRAAARAAAAAGAERGGREHGEKRGEGPEHGARIMPSFPVPAVLSLSDYDHVLLDLDGCVWVGDAPTPRAQDAIARLREAHKGIAFVTNDGRHGDDDYVRKLRRLGFQASREGVVPVGGALQHVLAESEHRTAYVVGAPAVHRHVLDAGLRILNGSDLAARADLVVVAAHGGFDYAELRGAIQAVLRGASLLCAGRDPTFPMPDGPWPGAGPVVAAIEAGTGATAVSVGKPEPQLLVTALDRLGPGRALMVGDRLDSDAAAARAAGLDCAIVLTGATSAEEARAADLPPARVADSLADLVLGA